MIQQQHITGMVMHSFGGVRVSALKFVPDNGLIDPRALVFRHNGTEYAVHLNNDTPLTYEKSGKVIEQVKEWIDATE